MNNQELIEEFLKIVTGPFGNVSKRWNEKYFKNNNKQDIWNEIFSRTSFLPESNPILYRLESLKLNLTELKPCKKCGENAGRFYGHSQKDVSYSEYCCIHCQKTSQEHAEKVSKGRANLDHDAINKKREATMLERFGYAFNTQRPEVKEFLGNQFKKTKPEVLEKLNDKEWMYTEYVAKQRPSTHIGEEFDIWYGTVIDYLRKHNIPIRQYSNQSKEELEVYEYVCSLLKTKVEYGDKILIEPFEIDILSHEHKFGIELNGNFWHSFDKNVSKELKEKHLMKTLMCLDKGYRLIHISEYEWIYKNNIVKSIIKNALGLSNKIHARKCKINIVSKIQEKEFLEINHIQGKVGSKICYGLFYENELVQLMSFGVPRFNKQYQWELLRSCSKLNTSIIGGTGKLFNHFKNNHNGSIICYADRRYGEGKTYEKIGMKFSHNTAVGYAYTNKKEVFSRYKYQKHKLKYELKIYDEKLSETENMFNNGFRQMWDCGNAVYVLESDIITN